MYLVLKNESIMFDRFDGCGADDTEILGVYSSLNDAREIVLNNIHRCGLLQCHYRREDYENKLTNERFYYCSDEYFKLVSKTYSEYYNTSEDNNVKLVLYWEFDGFALYDEHTISFEVLEFEVDRPFHYQKGE